MRKFLLILVALSLFWALTPPVLAECVGPADKVVAAQAIKADAWKAVEAGDLDQAAALFFDAADAHPKKACAAAYRMNGVGALVGTWNPAKGWRWDPSKIGNVDKALAEIVKAQAELDDAKSNACTCAKQPLASTQTWIDNQRKWLERMKAGSE